MGSPGTNLGTIRFGAFELDSANRELLKRGKPVKLQPQQFAVLQLLVERAGQVVSREEIRLHIWDANTFVDFERGINFAINQIRAALGDDAEKPRFVETISRLGYRFVCPIEVFAVLLMLAAVFIGSPYSIRLHSPWIQKTGDLLSIGREHGTIYMAAKLGQLNRVCAGHVVCITGILVHILRFRNHQPSFSKVR